MQTTEIIDLLKKEFDTKGDMTPEEREILTGLFSTIKDEEIEKFFASYEEDMEYFENDEIEKDLGNVEEEDDAFFEMYFAEEEQSEKDIKEHDEELQNYSISKELYTIHNEDLTDYQKKVIKAEMKKMRNSIQCYKKETVDYLIYMKRYAEIPINILVNQLKVNEGMHEECITPFVYTLHVIEE